jgi:methionyl-tRNA synthetase
MVMLSDFQKLDLRVAEIIRVENVEGSDKLLVLQVDVGGRQVQLVAGIKEHYDAKKLPGKKIIVIANLEPAKIRGIESQGMLLAAVEGKKVGLVTVDKKIPVGAKVM